MLRDPIKQVTDAIIERSQATRSAYLERMAAAHEKGPQKAHLSCGNLAHAYAASPKEDQKLQAEGRVPNLGIVTAYNDMLSAHQPYEHFPQLIKEVARNNNATAQVAGGVPSMCDGVTQGQPGMELSLFSRDLIAMAAAVAMSHNVFDSSVYLGVCDKIVPGLVIAAASFGHIPAVFLPAGPMTSGISNDEKAKTRQKFATGEVGREELLASEMKSYHGPGTCTFYGTANTNQMLMEFMGLHLPGSSFVNPYTPLRDALTRAGAKRALEISALGNSYTPTSKILDEKSYVNGIVGLMATGGSTNLLIHLIAMARASGVILTWKDFEIISETTPLLTKIYPNGLADVNHFHAAGGLGLVVKELLTNGFLHDDVISVAGEGMELYTKEPKLDAHGEAIWGDGAEASLNDKIIRTAQTPFAQNGGLKHLKGNLGHGVMKISAVAEERRFIEAPIRVFNDQESVKAAFKAGELERDVIVVVRFQGPKANGMPELHSLTPILAVLQDRGFKVALVTDGRMSGASGKVPSAIHVCPEALDGGAIAKLQDGDILRVDANSGQLEILTEGVEARALATADLTESHFGTGRELFSIFRNAVNAADCGASVMPDLLASS